MKVIVSMSPPWSHHERFKVLNSMVIYSMIMIGGSEVFYCVFLECDNREIQVESTTSSVYTHLVGKIALQHKWTSVMLITDEGNDTSVSTVQNKNRFCQVLLSSKKMKKSSKYICSFDSKNLYL